MTNEEEKLKTILFSVANFITQQFPETIYQIVESHRRQLSNVVANLHNDTVAYGPFKGFRLAKESSWGESDRGAMILGLYELEILNALKNVPPKYKTFIDLGAADGYYGVGALVNNMFEKSYCFEISEHGQEIIKNNAILNGVEGRITIKGEARKNFFSEIPAQELSASVLLVDIEGAEFDVIDRSTFKALSQAIILIEIHDWVDGAAQKISDLLAASRDTHNASQITTTARDLSSFEELKSFSDTDRWILCSEGRPRLMNWFRFDPIQ